MTSTVASPDTTASMPRVAKGFRVIAIAEAFSWLGLLVGMAFKYGPTDNPIGVKIFDLIHVAIFVGYVFAALLCIRPLRWGLMTSVLALAAAVPPFFTLFFEMWALRTGRLTVPPLDLTSGTPPRTKTRFSRSAG